MKYLMWALHILCSSCFIRHVIILDILYMDRADWLLSGNVRFRRVSGTIYIVTNGRIWECDVQLWYHFRDGSVFVAECGSMIYLYVKSMMENLQRDGARRERASADRTDLMNMRFRIWAMLLRWGGWGMVVVCLVPIVVRNICTIWW